MTVEILNISQIFDFIFLVSAVVTTLIVWFETDAFVEYAKIIGGSKFFLIDDYEEKKDADPSISYVYYLLINHSSFFTRLISCPYCLGFWFTIILCALTKNYLFIPIAYVASLYVYKKITQ